MCSTWQWEVGEYLGNQVLDVPKRALRILQKQYIRSQSSQYVGLALQWTVTKRSCPRTETWMSTVYPAAPDVECKYRWASNKAAHLPFFVLCPLFLSYFLFKFLMPVAHLLWYNGSAISSPGGEFLVRPHSCPGTAYKMLLSQWGRECWLI